MKMTITQLIESVNKDKEEVHYGTLEVMVNNKIQYFEGFIKQVEGGLGELYLILVNEDGYISDNEYEFMGYKHKQSFKKSEVSGKLNTTKKLVSQVDVAYVGYKSNKDLIFTLGGESKTLSGRSVEFLTKVGFKELNINPFIIAPNLTRVVQRLTDLDDIYNKSNAIEECAENLGILTEFGYKQLLTKWDFYYRRHSKVFSIPLSTTNWYEKNKEKIKHTDLLVNLDKNVLEELKALHKFTNATYKVNDTLGEVRTDTHILFEVFINGAIYMNKKELDSYLKELDRLIYNLQDTAEKHKYKLR